MKSMLASSLLITSVPLAGMFACASAPPPAAEPAVAPAPAPVAAAEPCDTPATPELPALDGRCPIEVGDPGDDPLGE